MILDKQVFGDTVVFRRVRVYIEWSDPVATDEDGPLLEFGPLSLGIEDSRNYLNYSYDVVMHT